MSVNLHVCARKQLRDTTESIEHCGLRAKPRVRHKRLDVVHEHGRLGLLGFARLDHSEQAVPGWPPTER